MIKFETNDSPFFVENKNYCETIAESLKALNSDCSGWCNSFGFEIEATHHQNKRDFWLRFHKEQSTQNGIVIPVNAHISSGTEVKVSGLNSKLNATFGKSSLKRLFMSKESRNMIPSPYYLQANYPQDKGHIGNLLAFIQEEDISSLKLHHGTLHCSIQKAISDPLRFIEKLEKLTDKWV
jgi:hypothetical protein